MAAKKKSAKRSGGARKAGTTSQREFGSAILDVLTVAMIADGEIADTERDILLRFADEGAFEGLDVRAQVERTIERCLREGSQGILADAAAILRSDEERETAFASCVAIVATDGKVTTSEARMLRGLRDALGISTERAKVLAGPLAAVFA